MRVVKDAEERRNEILDMAEQLFCTKGFDQTSTNDIIREVGIARGTLYYYFASKEEILDAMIERMTASLIEKARKIATDESIPVLERLTMCLMSLQVNGEVGEMLKEQMHKPQNALMHQKMQEQFVKKVNPLITGIVKDGIAQGICDTPYPDEAVEMVMIYVNVAFDDLAECPPELLQRKIMGFIENNERILGMKQGSLAQVLLPLFAN